jgi:hypothetical protein
MRIVLLVLVVAAVALLAFPSSPTSPVAPGLAFAAEVSPMIPVGIDSACDLYCNVAPNGIKSCGTTPAGRNGCDSIVNNNCIYTLCGPCNPPCPIGPPQRDPNDPPVDP